MHTIDQTFIMVNKYSNTVFIHSGFGVKFSTVAETVCHQVNVVYFQCTRTSCRVLGIDTDVTEWSICPKA